MSSLRFGYALDQWKGTMTQFVRLLEHRRAFMSLSALGFRAVQLQAGTGRWANLGRPEHIRLNYGSADGLREVLSACGIDAVTGMTWDPSAPSGEEGFRPKSTSRRSDHDAVVEAAKPFLDLLAELEAECLVVRATESAWTLGEAYAPGAVAEVLDRLGAAAAERGVSIAVRTDALGAVRGADGVAALLEATDPALVGLAVATADLEIAGVDPVATIRRHRDRVRQVILGDTRARDETERYLTPHAEIAMLQGGDGPPARWSIELGDGLVDVAGVLDELHAIDFAGWVVVDSAPSPTPAESAMLNSWYLRRRKELS